MELATLNYILCPTFPYLKAYFLYLCSIARDAVQSISLQVLIALLNVVNTLKDEDGNCSLVLLVELCQSAPKYRFCHNKSVDE